MVIKKIHQIWLGPNKLNKKQKSWMNSWKKLHPDFDFILWNDQMARRYPLYVEIEKKCRSWAQRADILRCLILEELGGLYLDVDMECKKNIEPLLTGKIFVAGFESDISRCVCNALIYSEPHHPILKKILTRFKSVDFTKSENITTGPALLTDVIEKAPPASFFIYPQIFFYPFTVSDWKFLKSTRDSFAVHHWDTSWLRFGRIKKIYYKLNTKLPFLRKIVAFFKKILHAS